MPEATPVSPDLSAPASDAAEMQGTDTGSLESGPGPSAEGYTETNYPPGTLYDSESPEERFEPGSEQAEAPTESEEPAEQFGTMEDAGSPSQNQLESADTEGKRDE
jgi:hypothetical protein